MARVPAARERRQRGSALRSSPTSAAASAAASSRCLAARRRFRSVRPRSRALRRRGRGSRRPRPTAGPDPPPAPPATPAPGRGRRGPPRRPPPSTARRGVGCREDRSTATQPPGRPRGQQHDPRTAGGVHGCTLDVAKGAEEIIVCFRGDRGARRVAPPNPRVAPWSSNGRRPQTKSRQFQACSPAKPLGDINRCSFRGRMSCQ